MTNTQKININQSASPEGHHAMYGLTELTQTTIRDRIREREAEAASERLVATSRSNATPGSLRRSVGRLLIQAGRRVAGESAQSGSPAGRPAWPAAA